MTVSQTVRICTWSGTGTNSIPFPATPFSVTINPPIPPGPFSSNKVRADGLGDRRLPESGAYLEATQSVLQQHGGLWFWDESYVISRKRDSG